MKAHGTWAAAAVGLLLVSGAGLLGATRARAEDAPAAGRAPTTWVYDVRVVRVDLGDAAPADPTTWKPQGDVGATTAMPWSEILATLAARGEATILLDQRVTAIEENPIQFRQKKQRRLLTLRSRQRHNEEITDFYDGTYAESGAEGDLLVGRGGLQYSVDVSWESNVGEEGVGSVNRATWKGSRVGFGSRESLVLSHRMQETLPGPKRGTTEIYVVITGAPLPTK
jgi:hypothetical protein